MACRCGRGRGGRSGLYFAFLTRKGEKEIVNVREIISAPHFSSGGKEGRGRPSHLFFSMGKNKGTLIFYLFVEEGGKRSIVFSRQGKER